jgi:hypothetical protein
MTQRVRVVAWAAVWLGLTGLGQGMARADGYYAAFVNTTPASGGLTTYNYEAWLASGSSGLVSGDFLTLYDFFGQTGLVSVGGLPNPLAFAIATPLVGKTPAGLGAIGLFDDPSIPNISITYTPAYPSQSLRPAEGQPLFTFSVNSTSAVTRPGFYSGRNLTTGDSGGVVVASVPEPGPLVLAAVLGLVAAGRWVVRRLRPV